MTLPFRDRHDAGRQLGELLAGRVNHDAVVLGIPRGGIPVAYEVAHALHTALDIFLLRHLSVPGSTDLDFGTVASGGVRVLKPDIIAELRIPDHVVEEITHRERISLVARERTYRGHHLVPELRNRTVILVDDGTATALLLQESVAALREHEPARIMLALPLLDEATRNSLLPLVAEVVQVVVPASPVVPGTWYHELLAISHTEVRALLSLCLAEAQSRALAGNTAAM